MNKSELQNENGLKRKYQIFISSAYKELKEQRKELIDTILDLDHIPSGMEMFSAGDEEEFEVIKEAINQSDIYVALIGAQYGSTIITGEGEKSFTQLEFEYATKKAKKPYIVYLLNDKEFEEEREKIKGSESLDMKHETKIRQFREMAREGQIVEFFSLKDQSRSPHVTFRVALPNLLDRRRKNIIGYIRADRYDELSKCLSLSSTISSSELMSSLVMEFNKYETLCKRMGESAEQKATLSKFFWDEFGGTIFLSGYRKLFFESGSTIAYLSDELLKRLDAEFQQAKDSLIIKTNNILTYLQYVLKSGEKIDLVPPGPPEQTYGSTHGELAKAIPPPSPPIGPKETIASAKELIDHTQSLLIEGDDKIIFLMGVSGLQLSEQDDLEVGPYIGNYRNTLLKRAICQTKQPQIIFIDEGKIDQSFHYKLNRKYHYPVCTPSLPWTTMCTDYPIGVCFISNTLERFEEVQKSLEKYGLTAKMSKVPFEIDNQYCALVGNIPFYNSFEIF